MHLCSPGGQKGGYRYSPGYSEVLKTNRMYRPWYQFAIGYIPMWPASTECGLYDNLGTSILKPNRMYRPWYQFAPWYTPMRPASTERGLYANLGTSRYWKPTACTDLDTSSLTGTLPCGLLQQNGDHTAIWVLQGIEMYRPEYQFATRYIPMQPASTQWGLYLH